MQGIGVAGIERERLPPAFLGLSEFSRFQEPKPGLEERRRRAGAGEA